MNPTHDLHGFSQFLADRLAAGDVALPEEVVALWRDEHPLPEELAASVASLRDGLDDLAAGRTHDFGEVNAEVRRQHGWDRA